METFNYVVQVTLENEIKTCNLTTLSFVHLVDALQSCFSNFDEKFIQYMDDEGDLVVFTTNEELLLAVMLTPGILKIVLRKNVRISDMSDEMGWREQHASSSQKVKNDLQEKLEILEDMGFPRKKSLCVLRKVGGDLEGAVNVLADWNAKKENKMLKKKRKHDDQTLPQEMEKLQIDEEDDERRKNKKFREIGNAAHVQLPKDQPWPGQFKRIFVDGNNLMFLTNGLRKLTLSKKFRQIENVLASITEHFSENIPINAVLMFDGTPSNVFKTLTNGSTLTVTSARPQFPTTDRALIHWATNNPSEVASSVVVTSDRALSGELKMAGLVSVKPSEWLKFIATGDYKEWVEEKVRQNVQ